MTVVSCSTATVETEAEMSCRSAAASIIICRLVSYSVRPLCTSEWDFQSRGGARGGILIDFQQEAPWAMGNVWCTKLYAPTILTRALSRWNHSHQHNLLSSHLFGSAGVKYCSKPRSALGA